MSFSDFWQSPIFHFNGHDILAGQLISVGLGILLLYILWFYARKKWLGLFFDYEQTSEKDQRVIRRLVAINFVLISVLIIVLGLGLDVSLSRIENSLLARLSVSRLIEAVLIYYMARLIDEMLSGLLTHRYQQKRQQQIQDGIYKYQGRGASVKVGRIVQPIVYLLAASFIVQELNILPQGIPVPWLKDKPLELNTILIAVLILFVTRLAIWILTELVFYPIYKQRNINSGSQYAMNKLLTYFLFVLATVATLQYVGINLTVLLGGAAALLVGIGLGLQQTFNDLICGIILLFERTVEVGDIVNMNGLVGTVKKIGIRTSLVETRDSVSVIVPNSKLVGENVINWSHFDAKARFQISIGVAYGSDTEEVRDILLEIAGEHPKVLKRPIPEVQFVNFGDSSLDFILLFWSRELIPIETVKSELRFAIDKRFRAANISIPFPQRDIWIKKEE